jgi:hypothetical protein
MSRLKRVLILLLFSAFCVSAAASASGASEVISVTVNGAALVLDDAAPFMRRQRIMIPLGSFGRALNAEVKWDADKQEAFIYYQNRYCWVQVSNLTLYYGTYKMDNYGGKLLTDVDSLELPVRPEMINNRLVTPLASLAEALGGTVEWNAAAQTASVSIPQSVITQPAEADTPPPALPTPGYFELITLNEVITRYLSDDPFVLVQFDNNLNSAAMYMMLKAAADLKVKIYGLDIFKENAALYMPFNGTADGEYEVLTHMINGYERVETLTDPEYTEATEALTRYLATE